MRWQIYLAGIVLLYWLSGCSNAVHDIDDTKEISYQNTIPVPAGCIHDEKLRHTLLRRLNHLTYHSKTVKMAQLRKQLKRTNCRLQLPPVATRQRAIAEIYRDYKDSVVIFGARYQCHKCNKWHLATSSGFIISASGAFVTSYHVIDDADKDSAAVMTADENVYAIREVLAADKKNDFAILQLEGRGFTPLPMRATIPIGSPIYVISHPNDSYYMVTDGIVSRYFVPKEYHDPNVSYMMVTADFARGSSGGPVIDMHGNAVGVVSYTRSIYYSEGKHGPENLQMVFHHATTAQAILRVIEND